MMTASSPTSIPLPLQFLASGVHCGVRRYRPDLGLILSEVEATTVGVFTQNRFQAAPVRYCLQHLPSSRARAIITNSGQANAATGQQGEQDNAAMAQALAQALACDSTQVLTASTGVIGQPLAIDKIQAAVPELVANACNTADRFALAILTTDLVPKGCSQQVQLSQGTVTLSGLCKGSGMIHPNMATMLGYLLSDVVLTVEQAQTLLRNSVDCSFNMISVDGESSTNDCVFLMANGASGVAPQTEQDWQRLTQAFAAVSIHLAQSIAKDGEGATKLLEVQVQGAPELSLARQWARGLITSPLIKTAVYGESMNWGRVIARMGMQSIEADWLDNCDIEFQGVRVYSQGAPLPIDSLHLAQAMKSSTVVIRVDLHQGAHSATAWGCDLSEKYVQINADYC